jgi:glycosyltransferase involved in cell wall biosynthesis
VKILHLSPTYFSDRSFVGGGERYAYELARASAEEHDVTFVSFGNARHREQDGKLAVEVLPRGWFIPRHPLAANPFSLRLIRLIRAADVIHCHQIHTLTTDAGLFYGRLFHKKVFVTDLGGGSPYAFSYHLPLLRTAAAFLLISEYSRSLWAAASLRARPERLEVIYGGIDPARFSPAAEPARDAVLFAGRLMPHKGVDVLIDAVTAEMPLRVIGRPYSPDYYELLNRKAAGKRVSFETAADDDALVAAYQNALVTVLPSVYVDCYGRETRVPELLGLVVLESLACATPVIVTSVASLPEIVQDGVTGFIVPPNDPAALGEKIAFLRAHPEVAQSMGRAGREQVLRRFTWKAVAERCLAAYERSAPAASAEVVRA